MKTLVLAAALTVLPALAGAGPIEQACNASSRSVSRALCGCIQQVANATLNGSDQRLAATFFRDPHKAQEVRQSDNRTHTVFWQRYKRFGATAESYCRR